MRNTLLRYRGARRKCGAVSGYFSRVRGRVTFADVEKPPVQAKTYKGKEAPAAFVFYHARRKLGLVQSHCFSYSRSLHLSWHHQLTKTLSHCIRDIAAPRILSFVTFSAFSLLYHPPQRHQFDNLFSSLTFQIDQKPYSTTTSFFLDWIRYILEANSTRSKTSCGKLTNSPSRDPSVFHHDPLLRLHTTPPRGILYKLFGLLHLVAEQS